MENVLVGLLAVIAGTVFCLGGYAAMRIIFPIWGLFVGFFVGAGLVAAITGDGILATAVGWIVGAVLALVVSALAYLYFRVAVLLAAISSGFAVGVGIMAAFGVEWTWVLVLVGVAAGALVGLVALVVDLPSLVLVVVTALGGAAAAVFGVMLLVGTVEVDDLAHATTIELVSDEWWTYVLYLVLAVVGLVVQSRFVSDLRRSVHDQWHGTASTPLT